MRVWHNLYPIGDIVEYVGGHMYGVMEYPKGVEKGDVSNGVWLATMWTSEDVRAYIDWCHYGCDKEIWNRITRKEGEYEWV